MLSTEESLVLVNSGEMDPLVELNKRPEWTSL